MRILVLTNLYPNPFEPNRGLFNRHQICQLAEDHEVKVISPILWTDELAARRSGMPKLSDNRQTELDGISVTHPRYFYTPKFLRACYGRFFRASVKRTFNRIADRFRPDVVFAPWAYPDGWAAVDLGHRRELPVVVKVHGSDIHGLSHHRARETGTVAALDACEAIVVVSNELKQRLIGLGIDPEKICVVYNGTDTDVFYPGDRQQARVHLGLCPNRRIVLAVGNLVPVKGHQVLLKALAKVQASGVDIDCHLLGDGPLRKQLGETTATLGLSGRVYFHGAKLQTELGDWYRSSDLVVIPSLAEGIPNVILEAMACGIPLVASRVGGIPEVVPSSCQCQFVPAGDVQSLASAIQASLHLLPHSAPAVVIRTHRQAADELALLLADVCSRPRPYRMTTANRATDNLSTIGEQV